VTSSGAFAFSSNNLVMLTLPSTIEVLEDESFVNNQLTSIVLPANITTIGFTSFVDNPITNVIPFMI